MIVKGETLDRRREVPFPLMLAANPLLPLLNHIFLAGEVQVCVPGGSYVNADTTRIIEKGNGTYALQLTDAQVTTDGKVYVYANVPTAQSIGADEDIIDITRYDVDAASGGTGGGGGGGGGGGAGLITLATIISIVRLRGDYLSSLTFTDSYLTNEIQAAWGELYEIIANTFEGYWDTDAQVSTVAAQQYIALPSDCWRVNAVDILVSGMWRELRQVGIGDRNRFQPTNALPASYRLSSRGIEMYPTPDQIYTLRVTYTPMRANLGTPGIQFYNDWQEYVITGALLRLDMREERPIGEREAELGRQRERIIEAATRRRSQEPEYLQLRETFPETGWWE